jgi:hypothetical protein
MPLLRLVTLLLVFLSAFTRTLFFMIDPYATNNVIPPFLEATFFTITYPCLNTSICLVLLTLYELAQSTKKMTKNSGAFLPSTKKVFFIFSFFQFVTQFTADAIRSFGIGSEILVICQVYFIGWGLLVSVAFGTVGVHVYKLVGQSARAQMWRTFVYVVCSCLFGATLAIFAVIRLTVVGPTQPDAYFALMTIERTLEVSISISMVLAVLPREHADVLFTFTSSVTGSFMKVTKLITGGTTIGKNSSRGGTTTSGNTSQGNTTPDNSTGGNTTMGNNGKDEGKAIVIQTVSTSSVVPYPEKEATSTDDVRVENPMNTAMEAKRMKAHTSSFLV